MTLPFRCSPTKPRTAVRSMWSAVCTVRAASPASSAAPRRLFSARFLLPALSSYPTPWFGTGWARGTPGELCPTSRSLWPEACPVCATGRWPSPWMCWSRAYRLRPRENIPTGSAAFSRSLWRAKVFLRYTAGVFRWWYGRFPRQGAPFSDMKWPWSSWTTSSDSVQCFFLFPASIVAFLLIVQWLFKNPKFWSQARCFGKPDYRPQARPKSEVNRWTDLKPRLVVWIILKMSSWQKVFKCQTLHRATCLDIDCRLILNFETRAG